MSAPLGALPELRNALEAGNATAASLVEQVFARARAVDGKLNALLHPRREAALAEAAQSDERRKDGALLSPLDGIPVAVKDNIVQRGEPASCGSRILQGYRSPFDSTAVARLRAAGAIVVARTNMDEFAMGSSTENSAFGPTRNPWDAARAPGGSSGGSAAAVAAGLLPLTLGSDTGGSIRQPAAFCGVVGVKPTYGRISRFGLVAFASSLDQIGPLGHSAADCAALLDCLSGHDARDSTSLPEPPLQCSAALDGSVEGLVLGLPTELGALAEAQPQVLRRVEEAIAALVAQGATTREVALPHARYGVAAYYLLCTAEASSNLARYDGVRYGLRAASERGVTAMFEATRAAGFGDEVKRRILLGAYALSAGYYDAYYRKAQQLRTLLRRDFERAFADCDAIVLPTTPETAFRLGARSGDPLAMYLSDIFTAPASLAGLPCASLPCGPATDGLPAALQIITPPREDARMLRVADAYQRRTKHHLSTPGL